MYCFQSFDRSYIDNPGPMVVFATPGMLHAGKHRQSWKPKVRLPVVCRISEGRSQIPDILQILLRSSDSVMFCSRFLGFDLRISAGRTFCLGSPVSAQMDICGLDIGVALQLNWVVHLFVCPKRFGLSFQISFICLKDLRIYLAVIHIHRFIRKRSVVEMPPPRHLKIAFCIQCILLSLAINQSTAKTK